ncbi:hypothetical protein DM15PD_05100 [Aristophania vespae]|nr:hypothetical protein DM15PD_05100 [Aristophania vespae]
MSEYEDAFMSAKCDIIITTSILDAYRPTPSAFITLAVRQAIERTKSLINDCTALRREKIICDAFGKNE